MRMRALTVVVAIAALACSKADNDAPAKVTEPGTRAPIAASETDTAIDVGIEAGGVTRDGEGPAGVIAAVRGEVRVRKLGEPTFAVTKVTAPVFAGDVVQTGDAATVQIVLADETIIEAPEVSTIAIASRHGSADPASSAAVLSGLARFTVKPRAPGEGAFRVYTPAGVGLATDAVFGVGVAASGEARIGVEAGGLDVIGLAPGAKPVAVGAGAALVLAASGDIASPAAWTAGDWGTWRDAADAKVELAATFDAHADALAKLSAQLIAGYAQLSAGAKVVATFEATAAASAEADMPANYEAALPDGAAAIDASFAAAGRLELLTWAYASHAALATELYVRHPAKVEAQWTLAAPHVDAAVLWPKRFEVAAAGYLEPLRMQYYVHHPRGRVHASLVGVTVPVFYANVAAPKLAITARGTSARTVWVTAPGADWHATVTPPALGGNFYVRPPVLRANVLLGAKVTGVWTSKLTVGAPEPRVNLRATWNIPVGAKVIVAPPSLAVAAKARARVTVPDVDVRAKTTAKIAVPKVKVKVPEVRAGIGVRAGVNAKAGAGVKVKAPEVKIKAPAVEVKAKAKIKIGL